MQSNLQTTVTDTLSLFSATRQAAVAGTKLFGRLDKNVLNFLILLASLLGLAYCATQYFGTRR